MNNRTMTVQGVTYYTKSYVRDHILAVLGTGNTFVPMSFNKEFDEIYNPLRVGTTKFYTKEALDAAPEMFKRHMELFAQSQKSKPAKKAPADMAALEAKLDKILSILEDSYNAKSAPKRNGLIAALR